MTSGVYMIRNTITDARYVGASRNVEARWRGHRAELDSGKHVNKRLLEDWQLHGADP